VKKLLFLAWLLLSQPLRSSDLITLRVTPQVGLAPLTVQTQEHIPSDPRNAGLILVIDGDGPYYVYDQMDLDERSPQVLTQINKGIAEGSYQVTATLYRWDSSGEAKVAATTSAPVEVK
jgi:hypothetical protein